MIHRMKAVRKTAPLVTWKFDKGGPCKRGETAKSSGCIPAKKEEAAPREKKSDPEGDGKSRSELIMEEWAKAKEQREKASKLEYDSPRSDFPADDEVRYSERCIGEQGIKRQGSPELRDEFKRFGRNRGCEQADEGWWDGLSDIQQLSLGEYTKRSTGVNDLLRGIENPENNPETITGQIYRGTNDRIVKELTSLFDSDKADLPEPRVVFRGVSGSMYSGGARGEGSEEQRKSSRETLKALKSLKPGDEFSMDGFQSTSASPQVAGRFSGEEAGDVMLEIKTDRGLPIFDHSEVSTEEELLLGNDWTYKVTGVVENAEYKIHRDKFVDAGYTVGEGTPAQSFQPDDDGTVEKKHVIQVELVRKDKE